MNTLVRHPGPEATESLLGYVLRLTEANGYGSPWNLYQFAGMKQHEVRTTGFAVANLCAVTKRPPAELAQISYSSAVRDPRSCQVLGHELALTDVDLKNPKVCPLCVMEKGFIEAYWDLALMIGCPLHQCSAVSVCAQCGKRLSWYRKGLLICNCGSDLQATEVPPLNKETSALLRVIHRVVIRETVHVDENDALPVDALVNMDLRSLLQVVRLLGRYSIIADGIKDAPEPISLVDRSAHVLSQWPKNFFRLLDDLDRPQDTGKGSGVRSHFSGLYTSVFKRPSDEDVSCLAFVREAFLEYLTQRWTGGVVDGRLLKKISGKASKRYVSAAEISDRYGVQRRTAARFLNLHPASFRIQGRLSRTLIDTRNARLRMTAPGKILRVRDAANALGISVPLLQHLRTTGLFEVDHMFPGKPGYHEKDVEAFRRRVAGLASITVGVESIPKRSVSLAKILKNPRTSVELKAAVLCGLFTGQLQVVATGDGSIFGYQIDRDAYREFVRLTNERLFGHISTRAAASELCCEPECIPYLVREGWLKGVAAPQGLRVTLESIKAFRERWSSLAALAREWRTSSRALRRRCELLGIEPLLVPSRQDSASQPFIRADQIARVMVFTSDRSKPVYAISEPIKIFSAGDEICVTVD